MASTGEPVADPVGPATRSAGHHLLATLTDAAHQAGFAAVGVTRAQPLPGVRDVLTERRAAGLAAGMQFTYRNPERSSDPRRILPGARSLVVGAWAYPAPAGDTATRPGGPPTGRVARYAAGDHYGDLRNALGKLADILAAHGHATRVVADDNALVDRAVAEQAGVGWFGKNANLLVPGHGSWVVLGSVVTSAWLPAADATVPDGCGPCRRCLDGCPTGAIVAPGVVDARRCLAWVVQAPGSIPHEYRTVLGDRIYGCDDCQEVCPPSRRSPAANSAPGTGGRVDLLGMLAATDDDLLAAHARWYIADRNPDYLRRNALVAIGNTADPTDAAVADAITASLRHPAAVVRAHAVWAARRLGRHDLLGHLTGAGDPLVASELNSPEPPAR